jgi:hypothetical protein
MSKAMTLVSTLNQTGDVGHDEAAIVGSETTPRFGDSVVNG